MRRYFLAGISKGVVNVGEHVCDFLVGQWKPGHTAVEGMPVDNDSTLPPVEKRLNYPVFVGIQKIGCGQRRKSVRYSLAIDLVTGQARHRKQPSPQHNPFEFGSRVALRWRNTVNRAL